MLIALCIREVTHMTPGPGTKYSHCSLVYIPQPILTNAGTEGFLIGTINQNKQT
jgi:hypothetical protein